MNNNALQSVIPAKDEDNQLDNIENNENSLRSTDLQSIDNVGENDSEGIAALQFSPGMFTAFHRAVKDSKIDSIKSSIENTPSLLNNFYIDGKAILHWASVRGQKELIQYLLTREDLKLNAPTISNELHCNSHNNTALHLAYDHGHYDIITILLGAGAKDSPITHTSKHLILSNERVIHKSVKDAQLNILKQLLENDITLLEQRNTSGKTPLLLACQSYFKQGVKYLISKAADVNVTVNNPKHGDDEKTALHLAYLPGRYEIVQMLIEAGAVDTKINGEFVFHKIIKDGKLELAKLFLEKQPILLHEQDNDGNTAIMLASQEGWNDIVLYLQTLNANLTSLPKSLYTRSIRDNDGDIIFPTTANCNLSGQIEALLNDAPVLLNQANEQGYTFLMLAAQYGQIETMHCLISQKNIALDLVNSKESSPHYAKTALDLAYLAGNYTTMCCLLEAGAKLNLSTNDGKNQYLWAAQYGCIDVVERILDENTSQYTIPNKYRAVTNKAFELLLKIEQVEDTDNKLALAAKNGYNHTLRYLLLQPHLNVNKLCSNRKTAIRLACEAGHFTTVNILLEAGAQDYQIEERYLIHIAAGIGNLDIIKLLLEKRPELLNQTDHFGQTALLWAASRGHVDIVSYLIELSADLSFATKAPNHPNHGRTALDWAIAHRHQNVAAILTNAHTKSDVSSLKVSDVSFFEKKPIKVSSLSNRTEENEPIQTCVQIAPNLTPSDSISFSASSI